MNVVVGAPEHSQTERGHAENAQAVPKDGGRMTPETRNDQGQGEDPGPPEFQVKEPLVLISIGVTYCLWEDPYDAVRYAWRVSLNRVTQHDLVLAHFRGVVVGAYRPTKWLPATRENFPDQAKRYNDVDDNPHQTGRNQEPLC